MLRDVVRCCEFIVIVCFIFVFFFSSRRRHTRSKRDWSSDVCSSDLEAYQRRSRNGSSQRNISCREGTRTSCSANAGFGPSSRITEIRWISPRSPRSEERRVGKECRSRWWREYEKRKEK